MPDVHVVVLAAGKGTRMKSDLAKVLHRVAGRSMIDHVLAAASALQPRTTTIVVGHQADAVKQALAPHAGLKFALQEPQLGTAHALQTAEASVRGASGTLVLLSGDVPLLSARTLEELVRRHEMSHAAATVVTASVEKPEGYGRIVRSEAPGHAIERIVEDRDATAAERAIHEINAGIYAFRLEGLFDKLRGIASKNAQREFYLPDLVAICRAAGEPVETVTVSTPREILGINSRLELAEIGRIVREAKNQELMAAGVTIEDPATAYIDQGVTIGRDTVIRPGVTIEGHTTIGSGCEIHSGARIIDSTIGDRVTVLNHCVITGAHLGDDATVGPFAHLRKDSILRERAKVGNFVEMKKTTLGPGSKSMHLSYLGDAVIGSSVNVGAGTITCNYDGAKKHPTIIEDGAFIGSDTQLIAPVTVGKGAYVGTGTTVRENVPEGALAVSAGKQRNIEGWVEKRKSTKN